MVATCDKAPINSAESEHDDSLLVSISKGVFIDMGEGSWDGIDTPCCEGQRHVAILHGDSGHFNPVHSQLPKDTDHSDDDMPGEAGDEPLRARAAVRCAHQINEVSYENAVDGMLRSCSCVRDGSVQE